MKAKLSVQGRIGKSGFSYKGISAPLSSLAIKDRTGAPIQTRAAANILARA